MNKYFIKVGGKDLLVTYTPVAMVSNPNKISRSSERKYVKVFLLIGLR